VAKRSKSQAQRFLDSLNRYDGNITLAPSKSSCVARYNGGGATFKLATRPEQFQRVHPDDVLSEEIPGAIRVAVRKACGRKIKELDRGHVICRPAVDDIFCFREVQEETEDTTEPREDLVGIGFPRTRQVLLLSPWGHERERAFIPASVANALEMANYCLAGDHC